MGDLNTNYLAPTGREEAWRFSPVKKLQEFLAADSTLIEEPTFSLTTKIDGVTLDLTNISSVSNSADAAVNKLRSQIKSGQILEIKRNFDNPEAIRLNRNFTSDRPTGARLQVILGENAHANLIIDNAGTAKLSEEIEFVLQQGSSLHVTTLAEWSDSSIQLARHHAILAKDSQFVSTIITLGGQIVRLLPTVEFTGPGAFADLSGLYFATNAQHLEHRLHIDHNVSNAKSRVNYKGALAGEAARAVWIGDVYIRANAQGTDTYELNRNLLLTDGARADSVPNLEIETGEIVGAGHASTTGKFDEEQLFYLMSRGVSMTEARKLVIRGFFGEIISKIKFAEIEERLMARIDQELMKTGSF